MAMSPHRSTNPLFSLEIDRSLPASVSRRCSVFGAFCGGFSEPSPNQRSRRRTTPVPRPQAVKRCFRSGLRHGRRAGLRSLLRQRRQPSPQAWSPASRLTCRSLLQGRRGRRTKAGRDRRVWWRLPVLRFREALSGATAAPRAPRARAPGRPGPGCGDACRRTSVRWPFASRIGAREVVAMADRQPTGPP